MPIVRIDMQSIRDREAFHDVFAETLGLPDFYGRNLAAWRDCLYYEDDGMNASPARGERPFLVLAYET